VSNRKQKLPGVTYKTTTGCGAMYVTINEDEGVPIEVFATMGKAGGCAASQIEAIGRLISLALRNGIDPERIVKQMVGISCHYSLVIENNKVTSCADAIGKTLKQYMDSRKGKIK
jgi:ribonucleoside-diphosphate reductase alpha chain